MTHFIRNDKGEKILTIEVFTTNIGSVVDIELSMDIDNYTELLFCIDDKEIYDTTIEVFEKLIECRDWYWNVYRETINKQPTIKEVNAIIGLMIQSAAGVLNLKYIID